MLKAGIPTPGATLEHMGQPCGTHCGVFVILRKIREAVTLTVNGEAMVCPSTLTPTVVCMVQTLNPKS